MTSGVFALAANLVEAGALKAAEACQAAGIHPRVGIAGVLAQLKHDGSTTTTEDDTHDR